MGKRVADMTPEERERKRARSRAYRVASPEKCRARVRAWRAANPEKHRAAVRTWRAATPEACRTSNRARLLARKYGLTHDDLARMLVTQNGQCAFCGEEPGEKKSRWLVVDHCHRTGKVRALLHNECNALRLGPYEKYGHLAAAYLSRFGVANDNAEVT